MKHVSKKNSEHKMREKWSRRLSKLPASALIPTLIVGNLLIGLVVSWLNLTYSSLTQGFSMELVFEIILINVVLLVLNMVYNTSRKTLRNNYLNSNYVKYLDRMMNSHMKDIQKVSSGKIFDAVKDLATFDAEILLGFIALLPVVMPFSVLIVNEWRENPITAVISLTSVVITTIMCAITNKLFGWNDVAKEHKAILQGFTVDNFMNLKTIKFLGQQRFARDRLVRSQEDAIPYMVNTSQALWYRLVELIRWTPLIINVILCRHNLQVVALIVLCDYTLQSVQENIQYIIDVLIERKSQMNIIACLDGSDDKEPPFMNDKLVLRDVKFDYGEDSVEFFIKLLVFEKGLRYHVTGESGEGKSSLANLLAGSITPTSGYLRQCHTYYIWQETEALDDTLWNNIVFDNIEDISEEEVLDLFEELDMLTWFNKLKDGFNTLVGERGCRLSSGQKQRVNIIRAVLHMRYHPEDLFILDEITSNLDRKTEQKAINLIDRECKSTLILISHHGDFDEICDRHIVVKDHKFCMLPKIIQKV